MARVAIQFVASSQMGAVSKDIAVINAELATMATRLKTIEAVSPKGLGAIQKQFATSVNSMKGFEAQTMSTRSTVQRLTDDLNRQKTAFRDIGKVRKNMDELIRAQRRLQESMALVTGTDMAGKVQGQLVTPLKAASNAAREHALRTGIMGTAVRNAGLDMVKTGKQAQWTGRQLSTGFTLPLVALAGVAAKAAYDIDHALTRLTKVYGDLNGVSSDALEQVRKDTVATANTVAQQFGIAGKETVELAADLAAAGYQGRELQQATYETQRIATLGELDRVKAMETTRAAMVNFGVASTDLGKKFDFLNAIENQTSTTLQDLADGIPRVAGVIVGLGGTLEDAAIYTVAFRNAGFTAAQGANALRASLGAMVQPSKQVKQVLGGLGIDIDKIVNENAGNLTGTLQALGGSLDSLSDLDKQRALSTLFGRYRYVQMGKLLEQLSHDATNMSTQVGKAFSLAGASSEQLHQVAERELTQLQESVSGRISRAAKSIVMEFARIGKPILEVVADIMEGFSRFLKFMNGMPSAFKWMGVITVGLLAIAGPLLYIRGLFKAFIGNILTMVGSLMRGKVGFTELSTAQTTFATLAEQAVPKIESEALALNGLTAAIERTTLAYANLSGATARPIGRVGGIAAPMNSTGGAAWNTNNARAGSRQDAAYYTRAQGRGPDGRYMHRQREGANIVQRTDHMGKSYMYNVDQGRRVYKNLHPEEYARGAGLGLAGQGAAAAKNAAAVAESEKMAAAARAQSAARMGAIASSSAMAAGMITSMAAGSNKLAQHLGMGLIVLGMFPALLGKIAMLVKTTLLASIGGAGSALAARMSAIFMAMRVGLLAAMGPIAAIVGAIALIGVAFYRNSKKVEEQNRALKNSAKDLAKTLGAEWNEFGGMVDDASKKQAEAQSNVEKFRDGNKEAVKQLREAYDPKNLDKVLNMVRDIGSQVFQHTGNADAAQQSMETALKAIGHPEIIADLDINFKNAQSAAYAEAARLGREMGKISGNEFESSWTESIQRTFGAWGHRGALTSEAARSAKEIADEYSVGIANGMDNPKNREQITTAATNMHKLFTDQYTKDAGRFTISAPDASRLKAAGIDPTNLDAVREYLALLTNADAKNSGLSDSLLGVRDSMAGTAAASRIMADELIKQLNLDPAVVDSNKGISAVFDYLENNYKTISQVTSEYNTTLQENARRGRAYSDNAKRLLAEELIRKYNLKGVTAEQIMNTSALNNAKDALNAASGATAEYAEKQKALQQSLRGTTTEELQKVADAGFEIFDATTEHQGAAYDEQQKVSDKYYSDREKALEKDYDGQYKKLEDSKKAEIDAVNDKIDAEQKLDEKRKALFDAQMTRLQRLAEAANMNIDYNVAFNSGNLDEAAKISNSGYVTYIGNMMDDAAASATSDTDAKRAAADKKIEGINTTYDDKKTRIDDAKDAAKELLDVEKDAAKNRIDARRKAFEKMREDEKKAMQQAIGDIVAEGARSQGEFQNQLTRIGGLFDSNTSTLLKKSDVWTSQMAGGMRNAIIRSRDAMAADKKWEDFGVNIANLMAKGATGGMNWDQLLGYLANGTKPPGFGVVKPTARTGPAPGEPGSSLYEAQVPKAARHTGGPVDGSTGSRLGRSGGLRPDEQALIAQRGEYVMSRDAVAEWGVDTMHAMNQGKNIGGDDTGRYHTGGYVAGPAMAFAYSMMGNFHDLITTAVQRKDDELISAGRAPENTIFGGTGAVTGVGGTAMSGGPELAKQILHGLLMQESGGNYSLKGPGTVSGGYQFTRGTWNNYKGFQAASDAPPAIQDERAMMDLMSAYNSYHDWEKAIAHHFYPAWANDKSLWGNAPSSGGTFQNPTIRSYVNSVLTKAGFDPNAVAQALGGYSGGPNFRLGKGIVSGDIQHLNLEFLKRLANWSSAVGKPYVVGSGFRSMDEQAKLYANYMAGVPGQAKAAEPGKSNHNFGLAADGPHWGGLHPERFGLRYPMSYEPWHVEPVGARGMRPNVPGLRTGGTVRFDNTLANLHRDEKVLTAPLSRDLERGIRSLDNSQNPSYNITINGADKSPSEIADEVMKRLQRKEQSIGINRRVKND